MKAKVLVRFYDVKEKVQREVGDVIDVAKERLDEVNSKMGCAALRWVDAKKHTKAELIAEAEGEMTNAELADAIEKAKDSPAKPKPRKAK